MRVLVTGAGGFLGRAIVTTASAAGHDVVALVRSDPADGQPFESSVQVVRGDLRSPGEWSDVVATVDAVVHAAAAAGGDRAVQLANSVVATERLLAALRPQPGLKFVHVSSMSVYDYRSLPVGGCLDEHTPLERRPEDRDAYTEAKLHQERLVVAWCESNGVTGIVVRPGAIVGPGKTWGYGAALSVGRLALVVAPRSPFRMIGLTNCAEAIVRALDVQTTGVQTVNLIDDDVPTNAEYFRQCRLSGGLDLIMIPVPWRLLGATGTALQTISRRWLDGRLRVPEILDRPRQEARWKPLTYRNDRAHVLLGWRSTQPAAETIAEALG